MFGMEHAWSDTHDVTQHEGDRKNQDCCYSSMAERSIQNQQYLSHPDPTNR